MPFTKKSSIFACASYLFVWMIRHYRILVSDYKLNHFLYNIRKQNVDAFYRFDGYAGARLNMKFNEKKGMAALSVRMIRYMPYNY